MVMLRSYIHTVLKEHFLDTPESALEWAEENHANADPELARQYSNMYNIVLDTPGAMLELYRVVKVPSVDDIDFDNLGIFWSFEEDSAGNWSETGTGKNILLRGLVWPKYINWKVGFDNFLSYGEDEWEATLLRNSPVVIDKIDDEYIEPIKGNTGAKGARRWSVAEF